MKNQNSVLARFLLGGCLFIILAMPFHAFFTAWLASASGHFDVIRLWKELLLIVLAAAATVLLVKDKKLRTSLTGSKLFQHIALFIMVITGMAVVGYMSGKVSLGAAAYGLIIDTRFFVFMLVTFVAARKSRITINWPRWVLIPASVVVLFGLLQFTVLPNNFLSHFGYGTSTIPAYQNVDNKPELVRLQSTLRGPNPLGAYLVAVLILAFAYSRRFLPKQRLAAYAAIVIGGLVLFATYSRSAYLGLFIAGAFYVYLSLTGKRQRRLFASLAVISVLLLAGAIIILRDNNRVQNVVFHTNELSSSPASSNFHRTIALKNGVLDIVKHPLGDGVGSAGPASFRNSEAPPRISENFFLQIGQEAGLFSLGLFMGILAIIFRRLWLQRDDTMSRALLAAFVGLIVVNLVSHAWADDTLAYVFFGAVGFALAGTKTVQKAKLRATINISSKRDVLNKRQKKLLIQFAEYMISGGAYFWVGYLVFFAADKGLGWSLWWSKLAANIVGWSINFVLQRYWVFKNPHLKGHLAETSGRYMFITLVNFMLDYVIVATLKSFGLTPYIGQFVSSGFFTIWNYLWYRFWVFPEQHKKGLKPRRKR